MFRKTLYPFSLILTTLSLISSARALKLSLALMISTPSSMREIWTYRESKSQVGVGVWTYE